MRSIKQNLKKIELRFINKTIVVMKGQELRPGMFLQDPAMAVTLRSLGEVERYLRDTEMPLLRGTVVCSLLNHKRNEDITGEPTIYPCTNTNCAGHIDFNV